VQVPKDQKGVDESDPNDTAGNDSDGAADQSKKMVPLAALEAERKSRQKLETDLARLSGTVEGLKASQQKPADTAPTIYTRAQLRAMVNDGKITEDQMDAQLEAQLEAKLTQKVETTAKATAAETRITAEVNSGIAAYLEAFPDLNDLESETREKVHAAFDRLCRRGAPDNVATELSAMEAALGPLTPKGRKKQPETHQETGGSGSGPRDRNDTDATWAKGLTAAQKAHYQKQIDRGGYSGTTDKRLVAEVKLVRERRAAH
jgi:hypothetical protein